MTVYPLALDAIGVVSSSVPASGILPQDVGNRVPNPEHYLLVQSIKDGINFSNSPPINAPNEDFWISIEQNILGDIDGYRYREMNDVERKAVMSELFKLADPLLAENSATMRGRIRRFVSNAYKFHLQFFIADEIRKKRPGLFDRKHDRYIDLVREGYQVGGWPCGWSGQYPEGNMLLYWPYDFHGRWMQPDDGFQL